MPCNKPPGPIDYYCEPRLKSGAWKVTDWKLIVDQHGPLVWATASRLLGNHADAQDCFQETFFEAIKLARREPVRDWGSLLRHLATVRALDLLRVRCRRRSRTDALADPAAAVGREAIRAKRPKPASWPSDCGPPWPNCRRNRRKFSV